MAVKVIVARDQRKGPMTEERYPDGTGVLIAEGHLIVKSGSGDRGAPTVAVYAPGHWSSAEVESRATS